MKARRARGVLKKSSFFPRSGAGSCALPTLGRMPHWMMILNGNAAGREDVRTAVLARREQDVRLDVRVTWEQGDARRYVAEAIALGVDTVIAAGGDGTLNEVCGALAASEGELPAVAVMPLGTANDFATAIDMPVEPEAAFAAIAAADAHPLDMLRIEADGAVHWCVNVATGGFGTQITVDTDPGLKRLLGKAAYLLTGLTRFDSVKPAFARFAGPGFTWQGDFLVLALGNGRLAGGGQALTPDAEVDDGLLDLTVLPPPGDGDLAATLGALITQGRAAMIEGAVKARLPWVEIEAPDPLTLNLDGEPVESTRFRVTVMPARLRLRAPVHTQVIANETPAAA
jgi:lipid kinase YegS